MSGNTVNQLVGYFSLIVITILSISTLYKNYKSKIYYRFWSPLTFISLIYLYYVVIAPVNLMWGEKVTLLSVDLTQAAYKSWMAACVSFISIIIGFNYSKGINKRFWTFRVGEKKMVKYGLITFVVGYGMWVAVRGFHLNAFSLEEDPQFTTGGFPCILQMEFHFW